MSTFAERLNFAMTAANLSQTELSETSGISKAAVSQYLAGKNIPRDGNIRILASIVGVTYEFLTDDNAVISKRTSRGRFKITPKDAANCLGKSEQFVRVGLQRGILPFGRAVPGTGSRWNYYISPPMFRDFVGTDAYDAYFGVPERRTLCRT